MDAHPASFLEPQFQQLFSNTFDPLGLVDDDAEGFPSDLSPLSDYQLISLADSLFHELDSSTPDLRAMERYETICDELTARQINSGVA